MLKYDYWRTVLPEKDWITEPEFDPHDADYGPHEINRYVAHMFSWLCGKGEEFRLIGGQAWPWNHPNKIGPSYGFGSKEGYVPEGKIGLEVVEFIKDGDDCKIRWKITNGTNKKAKKISFALALIDEYDSEIDKVNYGCGDFSCFRVDFNAKRVIFPRQHYLVAK